MPAVVRRFERRDRDQLTELINLHVAAVIPGVALSVNTVLSQLKRKPGESIVDPWVAERCCLVAELEHRIVAAALLHRDHAAGREQVVGPLAGELVVKIRVDGRRLWMHAEDLGAARQADIPTAVRLLPPYDPVAVEVAHRQLLLPDPAHRRQVWRPVANPGLEVIAGEVAGTWRRGDKEITAAPFKPLSTAGQRAIRTETTHITPVVDVVVFNH